MNNPPGISLSNRAMKASPFAFPMHGEALRRRVRAGFDGSAMERLRIFAHHFALDYV